MFFVRQIRGCVFSSSCLSCRYLDLTSGQRVLNLLLHLNHFISPCFVNMLLNIKSYIQISYDISLANLDIVDMFKLVAKYQHGYRIAQ